MRSVDFYFLMCCGVILGDKIAGFRVRSFYCLCSRIAAHHGKGPNNTKVPAIKTEGGEAKGAKDYLMSNGNSCVKVDPGVGEQSGFSPLHT